MRTDGGHDLRHHGDAEVRDDGSALVDLAVNVHRPARDRQPQSGAAVAARAVRAADRAPVEPL
ncbi:aminotransferase, partial [Streptomyces nigra]